MSLRMFCDNCDCEVPRQEKYATIRAQDESGTPWHIENLCIICAQGKLVASATAALSNSYTFRLEISLQKMF